MCYSNNLFAEHLRKLAMSSWELQNPRRVFVPLSYAVRKCHRTYSW
jgi:hypothetical protein